MIDPTAHIGAEVVTDGVNPHMVHVGAHSLIGTRSALLAHCPVRGAKPVVVGDYCWLGYGVIVLPGVTIGDRCVIGAGSVVTNDIPDHSVAAGNPARVKRELTTKEEAYLVGHLMKQLPMGKDNADA